jgi:predicted secreted hydrolase
MSVIDKPLTENLKFAQRGAWPEVDVAADLLPKEYDSNSWFIIGHFEAGGHTLDYAFHLLAVAIPGSGTQYASIISVTDETTGYFHAQDEIYPASEVEVAEGRLGISLPNAYLGGDWDKMQIRREAPGIVIDTEVTAVGYPIYSKGTGHFPLLGIDVHHYSVPYLQTTGALTVAGRRYDVTRRGYTWFDRGWQNHNPAATVKLSWLGIYLDNGEVISLYDTDVPGQEESWATVLHPDGSQDFTRTEPLAASGFWHSGRSGQCYPARWEARIPEYGAVLDITPVPREQEVVSAVPMLHRYEGASVVTGTWRGQEVKGHACAHLIGRWPGDRAGSSE